MSGEIRPCLNCQTPLIDDFCSKCGQKSSVGRITFRETLDGFLSSTFALEGPFLSTIRLLFINPGKLFREFIQGRRKAYYKPVAFFVLLMAIYIITRALIKYDPLEGQMENFDQVGVPEKARKFKDASRFMVENINNIMFFLVFSIGLMLKLFFRKKYNLAEYTSIGFFITGIYILIGLPVMLINKYAEVNWNQFQLLLLFIYIFYSVSSLFQRYSFWRIIKYTFVSAFSVILYVILGYGFSLTVVLLR